MHLQKNVFVSQKCETMCHVYASCFYLKARNLLAELLKFYIINSRLRLDYLADYLADSTDKHNPGGDRFYLSIGNCS